MQDLRRSIRVEFEGSQGRTLAGIIDQPVSTPRGFALFSHCFTCNKDLKAIVRISRRLAEHGWGILRYDFAGLGNSQGDFSTTNFSSNRQDLAAAAAFLEREYLAPCGLIGHSFGGAASMSMAESLQHVRGVVSLAAPSDTRHLAELLLRMNPDIEKLGEGQVTIGGRHYTIRKQMLDDFRSYDLSRDVMKLTKPVLILHSPTDETVGYHHAMQLFAWVSQRGDAYPVSPGASLVSLVGAEHLLPKMEDLKMVADLIHVWFDRWMS